MFAVMGEAELAPGRADEAEAVLQDRILPSVKGWDGFVSGTWTRDLDRRRTRSVVIFQTKADAERAAQGAWDMAPPEGAPLTFRSFDIVEVVAQV